jgi:hypothetical protein
MTLTTGQSSRLMGTNVGSHFSGSTLLGQDGYSGQVSQSLWLSFSEFLSELFDDVLDVLGGSICYTIPYYFKIFKLC